MEPQFEPVPVKTVVNRVDNMPFRWSLNPYRGCTHRCIYCYARPSHAYVGFEDPAAFDRHILIRENAADALRRQLSDPRWRRECIAIGTVTDPYQAAEGRFGITRQVLEVLLEFRNPVSITTKSPLVTRDLDLLSELSRVADCTVMISVTTLDETIWNLMEPGAPHPLRRLEALATLRRAGIRAGVLLAPVLPGLTDREGRLEAVVHAAAEARACFITPIVLRLPDGVRQWFLQRLEEQAPALAAAYRRHYRAVHAPRDYVERIERRVAALAQRAGIRGQRRSLGDIAAGPVQTALDLPGLPRRRGA